MTDYILDPLVKTGDFADVLAAECDRYGLPHSLPVLLRHIYRNQAVTCEAKDLTIEILQERVAEAGLDLRATPRYIVAERIIQTIWEHALAGGPINGDYATTALGKRGLLNDAQRITSPHMDQGDAFA